MFGILIDDLGYKQDFVVVHEYELKEGEQLIERDWHIANSMNKPRWNFDEEKWEETEPIEPPQIDICPEDPIKVLEARVASLENVEAGLLFENAQHQIKIHEQEKKNKDQEVTNANLLLEIAILKGVL